MLGFLAVRLLQARYRAQSASHRCDLQLARGPQHQAVASMWKVGLALKAHWLQKFSENNIKLPFQHDLKHPDVSDIKIATFGVLKGVAENCNFSCLERHCTSAGTERLLFLLQDFIAFLHLQDFGQVFARQLLLLRYIFSDSSDALGKET